MTTTDVARTSNGTGNPPGYDLPALPPRTQVSQATAVEQTRAASEVLAAVQAAKIAPRDTATALERMKEACAQKEMADQAFYTYRRSGSTITGPTVHLARALAACWGNMRYGITELSREADRSEMRAWAWDMETNTIAETTFVAAHIRDTTRDGKKALTDERDIYENNANMGARRLREQILAVIPSWFTTQAKDACLVTVRSDTGGRPMAVRCDEMATWFRQKLHVTREQLEKRFGPMTRWDDVTLGNLRVLGSTINRGETTVEQEFEPNTIDRAAIDRAVGEAPKAAPPAETTAGQPPAEAEPAPEGGPGDESEPPEGSFTDDPWDGNAVTNGSSSE